MPDTLNGTASVAFPSDELLFKALTERINGKAPGKLTFSERETECLVDHVIREFEDADSGNRKYKENVADMVANWRGVTEEKEFPFEGCANVQVPFTSMVVEQMVARLLKAVFGGDLWSKIEYVEKQVPADQLEEANQWWNWETREVVK